MKATGIVKRMERKAADNKYLHKDFHQSMNILLMYLLDNYGKEGLIAYLTQYAKAYHKPLHDQLAEGNLSAMYNYLSEIYAKEEWPVRLNYDEENGVIDFSQEACPAISHIKALGAIPCKYYVETYNTVYTAICTETPVSYELLYFDEATGACRQVFKLNIRS